MDCGQETPWVMRGKGKRVLLMYCFWDLFLHTIKIVVFLFVFVFVGWRRWGRGGETEVGFKLVSVGSTRVRVCVREKKMKVTIHEENKKEDV